MKKLIVMLAVLLAAGSAHATLIDVTPGGFSLLNPPPIFFTVVALPQLAGANINGTQVVWSPFEPFGPNQFSITTDGINASISWDLTSTDGFFLQYVLVEGVGGIDNIYRPPNDNQRFQGDGFATIDGLTQIQGIVFFGTNVAPESGTTILFFGLGLCAVVFARRLTAKR
jgi:hypothetical protein